MAPLGSVDDAAVDGLAADIDICLLRRLLRHVFLCSFAGVASLDLQLELLLKTKRRGQEVGSIEFENNAQGFL